MEPGEFDLVGFAVGVVERARSPAPSTCAPATASSESRAPDCGATATRSPRAALLDRAGRELSDAAWTGAHHSLAEELLRPSAIYAPAMLKLASEVPVHAFAHVTGGGIPGNLVRVLPDRCDAVVRRGDWEEPRIFAEIQRAGTVPEAEMEHVFNLGLGMLAVVPHDAALARGRRHSSGEARCLVGRRDRRRPRPRPHRPGGTEGVTALRRASGRGPRSIRSTRGTSCAG